ncbi:peptidase S46 [Aureococcus anophagefferens]|nr:peptidase S46 [Aureococcus anophagefferens]
MGLKIDARKIDGTSSADAALSDALVSVGASGRGGTGSFVSDDGLILTNWHVRDEAGAPRPRRGRGLRHHGLRRAEPDRGGPRAQHRGLAHAVRGRPRRSPRCSATATTLTLANKVRDRRQEIAAYAETALKNRAAALGVSAEGVRCEVQEQFAYETYVLFTYERLRDVRIVYAPPRSLGNFGGDEDNFEWPRHTADFALLRVRRARRLRADYDEANVPFRPDSRLRLCGSGAADGDFVFLLGYPEHEPLRRRGGYGDEVTTPALIRDFKRKLELIGKYEVDDDVARLKLAGAKDLELIYGELEDGEDALDALAALAGVHFGSASRRATTSTRRPSS